MLGTVESTSIIVGNDNLFSSEIYIATTDSHSMIDSNTKKRINPSKSISIGNHNWIVHMAMILKGGGINEHTIVGAGAIVVKSPEESHSILTGKPARIVKRNTSRSFKRI